MNTWHLYITMYYDIYSTQKAGKAIIVKSSHIDLYYLTPWVRATELKLFYQVGFWKKNFTLGSL